MNLLERELHYPLDERLPAPGETIEVAPGIRWIRMGLPFALNHVNMWLMRDEMDGPGGKVEGWSVVDCCVSREDSRAQWERIFATQLDGLPILRVIVTHMHPDHIGLADWLCTRWNAPMWISATDFHVARGLTMPGAADNTAGGDEAADFFMRHGLADEAAVARIRERTGYYRDLVPSVPATFRRMLDGGTLTIGKRAWRCIGGYGHAPEHIALHCEEINVLIGGDMMLPRISTNISVHSDEPEADSLRLFLESIVRFESLPADVLCLPSHGKPFTGVHRRIAQLQAHHRDRLAELFAACAQRALSAAEAMHVIFTRELDVHQLTFALGETIAHLHLLWFAGQLQRRLGEDGVYRFGAAA
jgi:glyoxylase-like metal-dependent hydrolase (beta-lactamase superfamily II)